jgi:threonine aldolase
MIRRTFLKTASTGLAGSFAFSPGFSKNNMSQKIETSLNFTSDGLGLSPKSYAQLLLQITEKQGFKADVYCLGEVIHRFEEKVAKALGKEKAIYMPTGTLANHIALRLHCPRRKKALVQQQSHVYRDSGDAVQQLSGINLVPLAPDGITFTLAEVEKALQNASAEKVQTGIEAISIETPVRRQHLRRFDFEEMKSICEFAREKGIGFHLDGARIFGEAVISGIAVKEYAALFDTVYVSLYKYFNSIAGAILAGPKSLIEGLHNERRMFGGSPRSAWENVVVADYFFDNFQERFQKAQKTGKAFLEKLAASGKFNFEAFNDGTNVFKLFLKSGDPDLFSKKIADAGIGFPTFNKNENCFVIKLNESLNNVDLEEMAEVFYNSI